MGLFDIILAVVLFLFVIGFFVVVWKAAQDWRWFNIVAVCITMLLCVLFLFPTAGVLKSRAAWHQIREKLEVRAATVAAEQQALKYGDPNDPSAGEGLVSLDRQLSKLGIEAGRRWRSLTQQNNDPANIVLSAPAQGIDGVAGVPGQPDDAAAPAVAPGPLVPESMVVYGFAESPGLDDYLGEFRVTASTPTQVTLAPTGNLRASQVRLIQDRGRGAKWSLYELLPVDGHDPFIAVGSVPSDDECLGRVDEDLVRGLLADKVSPETLSEYLRDGSRATDDDPPLSRWWKVQFLKDKVFEVDSPDQLGALEGGFFDGNGRALDARLQRGDEGGVRFRKGDQILVKEEEARDLIAEGSAEVLDKYYLRPLNDYRFVLRRIQLRLLDLANRKTELEDEQKVLQQAVQKTEGMLVVNQDIKLKLEQDLGQFTVEKTAIQDYTTKLQEELKSMRAEMVRLHQDNQRLEQKLEAKHLEIERRLDSLTAAQ
ncbi:MAG: hypothetical protein ACR2NZ_23050 [Rubripirellula sp.]